MHRVGVLLPVATIAAIAHAAGADESRSAHQTFVVHVPSKVTFESAAVPPQPPAGASSTSNGQSASNTVEKAFRLGGTSAAGITAWVEVQSDPGSKDGFQPEVSLRIVVDDRNQWKVSDSLPDEQILQATSSGTGAATLILSSESGGDETVVITTIISNE